MDVLERLQTIFRESFHDDSIVLSKETTADDIEEWDSLSHVGLIVAVEKNFAIRFTVTEIAAMENVGALAQLIEEKTAKK